jgi:hypothetical protein
VVIDLSKIGLNSPAVEHALGLTRHTQAIQSVADMFR